MTTVLKKTMNYLGSLADAQVISKVRKYLNEDLDRIIMGFLDSAGKQKLFKIWGKQAKVETRQWLNQGIDRIIVEDFHPTYKIRMSVDIPTANLKPVQFVGSLGPLRNRRGLDPISIDLTEIQENSIEKFQKIIEQQEEEIVEKTYQKFENEISHDDHSFRGNRHSDKVNKASKRLSKRHSKKSTKVEKPRKKKEFQKFRKQSFPEFEIESDQTDYICIPRLCWDLNILPCNLIMKDGLICNEESGKPLVCQCYEEKCTREYNSLLMSRSEYAVEHHDCGGVIVEEFDMYFYTHNYTVPGNHFSSHSQYLEHEHEEEDEHEELDVSCYYCGVDVDVEEHRYFCQEREDNFLRFN